MNGVTYPSDALPVRDYIPYSVLTHSTALVAWLSIRAGNPFKVWELDVSNPSRNPRYTTSDAGLIGFEPRPGYCAKWVRQVHEFVYRAPWEYRAANANGVAQIAAQRGLVIPESELSPGDLVFCEKVSPPHGHIAIYLGEWAGTKWVGENTLASRGGGPGLAVTPLEELRRDGITLTVQAR